MQLGSNRKKRGIQQSRRCLKCNSPSADIQKQNNIIKICRQIGGRCKKNGFQWVDGIDKELYQR